MRFGLHQGSAYGKPRLGYGLGSSLLGLDQLEFIDVTFGGKSTLLFFFYYLFELQVVSMVWASTCMDTMNS